VGSWRYQFIFPRAESVTRTRLELDELSRDPLEEFLSFDCNAENRCEIVTLKREMQ
jgi:hypothetical protein